MAIEIEDKLKDMVIDLEDRINNNLLSTTQNYCELKIYTPKKKIAKSDDFQKHDSYFYIVDLQTCQTLGTISCTQDDYGINWVNVSAISNVFDTPQASFFDQYLSSVNRFSDDYYKVNFNDVYIQYNKNQNVIPKIQFIGIYKFSLHVVLLILTFPIYWISIYHAGFGFIPILTTAIMFGMFLSFIFGNDDSYY